MKTLSFDTSKYKIKFFFQPTDCPCGVMNIFLAHDRQRICQLAHQSDMRPELEDFIAKCKQALNGQLIYNKEYSPGEEWAHINQKHFIENQMDPNEYGKRSSQVLQLLLWNTKKTCTWLYNFADKIVFEVTPRYPWFFTDPEPNEDYYPYEKFKKNFKPIFKCDVNQKTIIAWRDKTNELLRSPEQNSYNV